MPSTKTGVHVANADTSKGSKPDFVPKIFFFLSLIAIIVFGLVLGCQFLNYNSCSLINKNYEYLGSGAIELGLFSIAMFFLWKKDIWTTLTRIGVPGNLKNNLIYSAIGLCAIFAALFMLSILSFSIGFNDEQKVSQRVLDFPPSILLIAVIVAPITEELFFRAFLSPRVGIIISAILFGIAHFTYGSVIEIIGVLFVGLLLGALYRMSKSLVPCILVHMFYNFLSISVTLLLGGKL